jgi:hypothetical protein
MEVPAFDEDVLYYVSAASGGGSVEMPFDRGIMSSQRRPLPRSGPRVLVVQQNLRFRALGASAALQENVATRSPPPCSPRCPSRPTRAAASLVDGTPLFMRDAGGMSSDAAARQPGHLPVRRGAQRLSPAADEGVPRQHGNRDAS